MRGIYIGLGSNLGDRVAHLAFAKRRLKVVAESPIYQSPAMLLADAPPSWNRPYLNQVVEIETDASPQELLQALKRIEADAGRKDRGRWAPRELDLDIIAYGDVVLSTPELTLPHSGMSTRDFVLLPLRDIAPNWPHIDAMMKDIPHITACPFHSRTQIMGILNITPDSFSGGGAIDVLSVVAKFEALVEQGADVIDIGAESTRPDAVPLSAEEEWQRLEAPLQAITRHALRNRVTLSVDTRHAETAKRAIAMGVDIINDVFGLRDKAMCLVLKEALCDVVVMHALTVPANANITLPDDADPVAEVLKWKEALLNKGIALHRLIFDPGIGFGKTAQQSLALIKHADTLVASGGRWLIGHSRKSFMDMPLAQRDAQTVRYSQQLVAKGVDYVRVHDVAGHRNLLAHAIESDPGVPGIKLTLERIHYVLDRLGNPEKRLPPVIHIAGTNGKGSVLAYLRAIYEADGKKVHAYTSPHLVRYNERVILAGVEVDDARFMDAVLRVKSVESESYPISVFERITAASYLCFSEVPADILLLETGLGGRFDTTNVTPKIATILTPIGMDHTEFLGETLAAIAAEKAAIMRANVPCICAPQAGEVVQIITAYAHEIHAPLHWAKPDEALQPALMGEHQRLNASVAATAARLLGVSDASVHKGVMQAKWPARLQALHYGPLVEAWSQRGQVVLDGGHNAHAAAALAEWIKTQDTPVILLCGMMARKNAMDWMRILIPYVAKIICVPVAAEGAYGPEILAKNAKKAGASKVSVAQDWPILLAGLRASPVSSAHILVAGSLYLAGDVLKNHG
jgi:dihydrofolate synthase/folylpolyglutamate synthase